MTERQDVTNDPQKAPQYILREKVANLKYQSSTENVALSELAGGTQELPSSIRLLIGRSYLYLYRDDITDAEHTHAKVQIGRFALDEEGNITDFVPDTDDSLVRQTISSLNHVPFFSELKNRFGIKDPDEENLARARQIAQESNQKAEEQQREIDALKCLAVKSSLNQERKSIRVESLDKIKFVSQTQCLFLGEDDPQEYLATQGLGGCIRISAYSKSDKAIGLAHVDAMTNKQMICRTLISRLGSDCEIRILAGNQTNIKELIELRKILDQLSVEPVEWDFMNPAQTILLKKNNGEVAHVLNPQVFAKTSQSLF